MQIRKVLNQLSKFMSSTPDELHNPDSRSTQDSDLEQSAVISDLVQHAVMGAAANLLSLQPSSNAPESVTYQVSTVKAHLDYAIAEASEAFVTLKQELESQSAKLSDLTQQIEVKKQTAEHINALISINEPTLQAIAIEIDNRLQAQLERQQQIRKEEERREQQQNRRARLIREVALLVFGAFIGSVFQLLLSPLFRFP